MLYNNSKINKMSILKSHILKLFPTLIIFKLMYNHENKCKNINIFVNLYIKFVVNAM